MRPSIDIPETVRITALLRGRDGQAWMDGLPRQIAGIEEQWGLVVGKSVKGGTEAVVAMTRTQDGRHAALKIVVPGIDPLRQEIRTLRAANGRGYAQLLRADEEANVLLLERLGQQLYQFGYEPERQIEIICATLAHAWMREPAGPAFATGAEKAAELWQSIESRWDRLGRPCHERTFAYASLCAQERARAFDPARSVIVHGDAHWWNTLAAPGSPTGFKFVDPDGAFAERAFDLAVSMREWGATMPEGDPLRLGIERCRQITTLTGIEPRAIREWSVLQCVSNGLLIAEEGFPEAASVPLRMADAWAKGDDWRGL